MLALCLILPKTYYAHKYAGIIGLGPFIMHAYIHTYSTQENIPTYYIDTQTCLPCITYVHTCNMEYMSTHIYTEQSGGSNEDSDTDCHTTTGLAGCQCSRFLFHIHKRV